MDAIDDNKVIEKSYEEIINKEIELGINSIEFYKNFNTRAEKLRVNFANFLQNAKKKSICMCLWSHCGKHITKLLRY